MVCQNCGATLPPNAVQCGYCAQVSHARAQELERRRFAHEHAQMSERADRERRLTRASTLALVLGIVGLLVSCFPLVTVGAFVMGADAYKRAKALGVPLPPGAKAGLVFAFLGAVSFVGFWAWVITGMEEDRVRASARKDELLRLIASRDQLPELTQATACHVAELHLLNHGFEGDTSTNFFTDFDCAGRLAVEKDSASLPDFRFRRSTTSSVTNVTVCFKHGSRWFVDKLSKSGDCKALEPAPAESTAQRAEPAPTDDEQADGGMQSESSARRSKRPRTAGATQP